MLPPSAKKRLKNGKWCFEGSYDSDKDEFIVTQKDRDYFSGSLNIQNHDSAFIDFYSVVGFVPLGNGEELYTLDQIVEDAESGFHSDEYPEIGKRYLQISSIEGEGSYFYDKETDAVYDVHWGEEEDMISGRKEPWFHSFYDFLEWYYSDDNEE